jgi:8-oxo-dGTP diphosphatase
MKILQEIHPSDVGIDNEKQDNYKTRKTARAVAYREDQKIAILFNERDNYHKLPGGEIEEDEDPNLGVIREVLEETGANIEVLKEIGSIAEYKDRMGILQISHCYTAKTIGEISKPVFNEKEIASGYKLKWLNPEEAINLMESDKPKSYEGNFVIYRDATFIKHSINSDVSKD